MIEIQLLKHFSLFFITNNNISLILILILLQVSFDKT